MQFVGKTSWLSGGALLVLVGALSLWAESSPRRTSPVSEHSASEHSASEHSAQPNLPKPTPNEACPAGYVPYEGRCLPYEQ